MVGHSVQVMKMVGHCGGDEDGWTLYAGDEDGWALCGADEYMHS